MLKECTVEDIFPFEDKEEGNYPTYLSKWFPFCWN